MQGMAGDKYKISHSSCNIINSRFFFFIGILSSQGISMINLTTPLYITKVLRPA